MGLFGSLFGKNPGTGNEENKVPWNSLDGSEQLEEIVVRSKQRPQLIFKHSASCGISRMVLNGFNSSFDPTWDCDLHFLTIQANRELSNSIADRSRVRHESCQLLILREGEVSFHTSHGAIVDADIKAHL